MTKIIVDIPDERPYTVRVASSILPELGQELRTFNESLRAVIITDTEVAARYLPIVEESLKKSQYDITTLTIPSGESAKSLEVLGEVWDAMAEARLGRDSLVVALGGGVVGDLAGFAGSTFMRGLPVIQVPTTLLSMVDSSVGGKTAINLPAGKNLVGTFCQPRYVCADVDTLLTLPEREWSCGCGEIAKSAVIDSHDFYEWLEQHTGQMMDREPSVVAEAVVRCVSFKANVVVADKAETKGVRECLNYGHTLAHAIETLAGYGTFSHGEAVAQGMRFAARLGVGLVGTSLEFVQAQDALLDALNLPPLTFKAAPEELLSVMLSDKKVRNNQLRFVLPKDFGQWVVETVPQDVVLEHLQAWQQSLS